MAIRHKLAAAALAASLLAGAQAAQAAIGIQVTDNNLPLPAGQVMIDDFERADGSTNDAARFTFTQNDANSYIRDGSLGLDPGVSAPPPGDATYYETVKGGSSATLTSTVGLSSISLYMGSPDDFNHIRFIGDGFDETLDGPKLFFPAHAFEGDQSIGKRITYDFGGAQVKQVIFSSGQNAFEFDNLAGTVAGVPEPSTWAMMLLGVFGLGLSLRAQRRQVASAAAA
jgi:hypothetical protein